MVMNGGFGDSYWPTLVEVADKFPDVTTRERIRQIINESFELATQIDDLPVAKNVFEIIESHDCISVSQLKAELIQEGLASQNTTIRGILILAKNFGVCQNHNLYDANLKTLLRSIEEFDTASYLLQRETFSRLKKQLKKAQTLPGRRGLANLEYLYSEIDDSQDVEQVIKFIRNTPNVCLVEEGAEEWYIYENRNNILLNSCGKIFSITEECNLDVLSLTLENSLHRRTEKYIFPSQTIIKSWIQKSSWFMVEGATTKFLGQTGELTKIERDAVDYLQALDMTDFSNFENHLLAVGHNRHNALKAITTSPLVTVDKSGQKRNHKYQLISKASNSESDSDISPNQYEIFKNKLKILLSTGTDKPSVIISRREQSILREWLFPQRDAVACAICGEYFSVSALIAAHKKKRALCTESERIDPYIVFPLCAFGCDYLYENDMIRIVDGVVQTGTLPKHECVDRTRALSLSGKKVEERWLKGSKYYFERNLA
jgi:hypothetical protein